MRTTPLRRRRAVVPAEMVAVYTNVKGKPMVKSNEDVGYVPVHKINEGTGAGGESVTVRLKVGRTRDTWLNQLLSFRMYRAYACLCRDEQVIDSLCHRDETPRDAMAGLQNLAENQWSTDDVRGLRRAMMEVQESMGEHGRM